MKNIFCIEPKLLKQIYNFPKLTQDTELFEGMMIYTLVRSEKRGAITKKGYTLLATDILCIPSDKDWEDWEKDTQRSRFDLDQDNYWTVVTLNGPYERLVLPTKNILEMKLSIMKFADSDDDLRVTYSSWTKIAKTKE